MNRSESVGQVEIAGNNVMYLIMWLLFGLIVGSVARFVAPGAVPGGWATSTVVGIGGAFLAGLVGMSFGLRPGQPAGYLLSLLGAILLVVGYHALVRHRRQRLPLRGSGQPL